MRILDGNGRRGESRGFLLRGRSRATSVLSNRIKVVRVTQAEAYFFFTLTGAGMGSDQSHLPLPRVCPLHFEEEGHEPIRRDPFDLSSLLRASQPEYAAEPDGNDSQANYRDLLRYTLQIAARSAR